MAALSKVRTAASWHPVCRRRLRRRDSL